MEVNLFQAETINFCSLIYIYYFCTNITNNPRLWSTQDIGLIRKWSKEPHPCDPRESWSKSLWSSKRDTLRHELTWSHYRRLISVENEAARLWYMNEAADSVWSTRQMDRQISTLYYERLLASRGMHSGTDPIVHSKSFWQRRKRQEPGSRSRWAEMWQGPVTCHVWLCL